MSNCTCGYTQQHVWFKSSYSSSSTQCVEVRFDGGRVSIRDSKNLRGPASDVAHEPIMTVTGGQWSAFINTIRS